MIYSSRFGPLFLKASPRLPPPLRFERRPHRNYCSRESLFFPGQQYHRFRRYSSDAMAGHFWAPTQEQIEEANVTKFRHFVNKRHSLDLKDYWDLHKWSTGTPEEINDFWTAVWDWSGIIGEKGEAPVSHQLSCPLSFEAKFGAFSFTAV